MAYLLNMKLGIFRKSHKKLLSNTSIDQEHPCSISDSICKVQFLLDLPIHGPLPGKCESTGCETFYTNLNIYHSWAIVYAPHLFFTCNAGLLFILATFSLARTMRFSSLFHWNIPSLNRTYAHKERKMITYLNRKSSMQNLIYIQKLQLSIGGISQRIYQNWREWKWWGCY